MYACINCSSKQGFLDEVITAEIQLVLYTQSLAQEQACASPEGLPFSNSKKALSACHTLPTLDCFYGAPF